MTRKQTMRLLTMLLVCIIILNFIAQPKAEAIGGSLALALGGTSAAKAFLAFIMSCVAMGVTYVTIDDAMSAYDHYKENASVSIEDLRYVQQETWTGNYEALANDLTDIHSGIKSWLEGLISNIQAGQNVVNNNIRTLSNLGDSYIINNKQIVWIATTLWNGKPFLSWYSGQSKIGSNIDLNTDVYVIPLYVTNNILTYKLKYTLNNNVTEYLLNTSITGYYDIEPELLIDISTDAPILNSSYSPQNRTFPPAPYLPYINPGNEKVSQSISAAGGTMEVYNGTYDQYLDDVVDNATWEDIQGVISGSVPTTTLTETAEGLIIGEATAGIPYPNPDTTAPGEVLTGLGGIMGLLQGITNWIAQLWQLISGIFAIPEGLALDFSSLRLVNFKDKFPFSIPWDIYRAVAVFAKSPETPDFSIDIETDYLNIDHSINLDPIDLPLRFARYVMTIFFIFFLASKTRDLIKW